MTLIWLPVFMPHTREEEVGQELFNDSKYVCLLDSNPEKEDRTTLAEQVIFFFFLLIARNSFSLLAWSKLHRCYKQKHTSKNTDDTVKCVVKMRCELILSLVNFQWNWCGDGMSILCYNCTRFAVWIDQFRQILIQNSQSEFLMGLFNTFAELWVM